MTMHTSPEDFKKILKEARGLRSTYKSDQDAINTALRGISDQQERSALFSALTKVFRQDDKESAEMKAALEHDRLATLRTDAIAHEKRQPPDSLPGGVR